MNDLILSNAQLPAHLAGAKSLAEKFNANVNGGLSMGFPKISIKGSRWRVIAGGSEDVLDTLTMDVIILSANPAVSKVFYAKQWQPGDDGAPDCYSNNGVAPDARSTMPQHTSCATCPQNAWGSKQNALGVDIKACADTKRLVVAAAGDPAGELYLLSVPAASLSNLTKYVRELSSRGLPIMGVVTQLSFDPDASYPKVQFKAVRFVEQSDFALVQGRLTADDALIREITGTQDAASAAPVATVGAVSAPAVVAQPAPQPLAPVAATPAPQAAPAKPRGFSAAPAAPKAPKAPTAPADAAPAASLADEITGILSGFDDE